MKTGVPKGMQSGGPIGFIESTLDDGGAMVVDAPANIWSPDMLTSQNCGRLFISGLKRRRTKALHGSAWDDEAYIATRNHNFELILLG